MQFADDKLQIARQFASALDACDYVAAAEFLASDCQYCISSDGVRVGRAAVLGSYRDSDEKARRTFDRVVYSSKVDVDGLGAIRLNFSDELHCSGSIHTFRCAQLVYFDKNARIHRIELAEIPGERDRLNEFCASHGIQLH